MGEFLSKIYLVDGVSLVLPHSVFRLVSSIENSYSGCHTNSYLFAYARPYQKSANNVWAYSYI